MTPSAPQTPALASEKEPRPDAPVARITARPVPLAVLLDPRSVLASLWRWRHLAIHLAWRDLNTRYRGNHLGLLWLLGQPLLSLTVFTFVFADVLGVRWPPGAPADGHVLAWAASASPRAEYAVHVFTGLVLYGFFADVASAAPHLVLWRPTLARRVPFPLETLAPACVLSWLPVLAAGVAVSLAANALFRGQFSLTLWLLPFVLAPLILFALAFAWTLSALGVFLRDVRFVVAAGLQLLLFTAPVFYPFERVPEAYRPLLALNPLTPVVEGGRRVILEGLFPPLVPFGLTTLVAAALALTAHAAFIRAKRGFPDVM